MSGWEGEDMPVPKKVARQGCPTNKSHGNVDESTLETASETPF